jgi:hypothetical protein
MKILALLPFYWLALAAPALGQVVGGQAVRSRTVPLTNPHQFDDELFRFLLATHQADGLADKSAFYKMPLLVNAHQPGIGVYQFGINSAHAGYLVVFRYRTKLVFSSALEVGPLHSLLQDFLAQHPTVFSPEAQSKVRKRLHDIVERNQTAGDGELPDKN